MTEHAELSDPTCHVRWQADLYDRKTDQEQKKGRSRPDDERGDLISSDARRPHPKSSQLSCEERGSDVLRKHDTGIGLRHPEDSECSRSGASQGEEYERPHAQKLADDQLRLGDRLCHKPVERLTATFFGQTPHRRSGDEDREQDREQIEDRSERRNLHCVHGPKREKQ